MKRGKVILMEGKIAIYRHPIKGFCVIARKSLRKDELITVSPVCVLDSYEDIQKSSSLDAYPMAWDDKHDCIAFGWINLLNHSTDSNIRLERDLRNNLIRAFAKEKIHKGEELTINYICKLWFEEIKEKLKVKL